MTLEKFISLGSVKVPRILYGTAWKEDQTDALVYQALEQGFKGLDTANHRKHYFEQAAGSGFQRFLRDAKRRRDDFFIQTKFTFRDGQDHRLPYDPSACISDQVVQSANSSLEHLQVSSLDSYVLHGPSTAPLIGSSDREAWQSMERLAEKGITRFLGLSNVSRRQLEIFFEEAKIKPRFVQNRCYASRGWDREVRAFCQDHQILYQGFSLLTANAPVVKSATVADLSKKYMRTAPQIIFRFALELGIIVLTGTTSVKHQKEALEIFDFELTTEERSSLEAIEA